MQRLLTLAIATTYASYAASAPTPPYASWAHSHFVWLSSDQCLAPACVSALVDGYAAHNITVGAVDIDSGWATGFNSFQPRPEIYPQFGQFVRSLHARGVRVILWMTSFVDDDSPNFQDAVSRDALVHDGLNHSALNVSWWHGKGGLLDYSSAASRTWWENQMRTVLAADDTGIDGWKCDGTDPYVIELITPRGADGSYFTFQQYSNWYYGHTLNFTRTVTPDALIWARPVDAFPLALNISAFLEYAPKYAMVSGWVSDVARLLARTPPFLSPPSPPPPSSPFPVRSSLSCFFSFVFGDSSSPRLLTFPTAQVGDQDPTFDGLRAAAINILESAWQGYANFGSDTAGYRGAKTPRTRELFVRWSQLNALLPLFENGGNDNHYPWAFDTDGTTQVTDMYRRLVNTHYALVPYLLTTGAAAFATGTSAITPTSSPPVDFPFILEPDEVSDWSYALGASMFVSPILYAGIEAMNVSLPGAPGSAGWVDLWDPTSTYPAGRTVTYAAPLSGGGDAMRHPAFTRLGSLLPLHVSCATPLVPTGRRAWAPALTLLAQGVGEGGAAPLASVDVALEGLGEGTGGAALRATLATAWVTGNAAAGACAPLHGNATLTVTASARPVILLLRRRAAAAACALAPLRVVLDGSGGGAPRELMPTTWVGDEEAGRPAALAWDATAPGGGRYPLPGRVAAGLSEAFAARLAGTYARSLLPPARADGSAFEEVAVFLGAADLDVARTVRIVWG